VPTTPLNKTTIIIALSSTKYQSVGRQDKLETYRSQQTWKHQRVEAVRPPNTTDSNIRVRMQIEG